MTKEIDLKKAAEELAWKWDEVLDKKHIPKLASDILKFAQMYHRQKLKHEKQHNNHH